jgi:hypothetical protein
VWLVHGSGEEPLKIHMEEKTPEVREVVAWLNEHVDVELLIVDHWEADLCAIGLAIPGDPRRLVYISTWNRPQNSFFVELEAAPPDGSEMPYVGVGKFESVDRDRLLQIVVNHLNLRPQYQRQKDAESAARFPCPCCGYFTIGEEPPGTFEICPVCFWEDDYVQFGDPDFRGGANRVSLNEARNNFKTFGASEERVMGYVRPPLPDEMP